MRSVVRSEPVIHAWFDLIEPDQQVVARALRDALMAAEPALVPMVKWGNLVFTLGGQHAFAIVTHRTQVNLQVFNGADLADRFPELDGTSRGSRQLKFRLREPIDESLVREVVLASAELMAH